MDFKPSSGMRIIPVCTTSVLSLVQICGLGIENRKVLLDGSRLGISEIVGLSGYALDPFLAGRDAQQDVAQAVRVLIHVQKRYFEELGKLGYDISDKKYRDVVYDSDQSLAAFYKRYLALCCVDRVNPYALRDIKWDAPFDFFGTDFARKITGRLRLAKPRLRALRNMDVFYVNMGRTLTTPVNVIAGQLKAFLSHLGEAAYLNAAGFCVSGKGQEKARDNLRKAYDHLGRLILDLLKVELFSMVKNCRQSDGLARIKKAGLLQDIISARAADHAPVAKNASNRYDICEDTFKKHYDIYMDVVGKLYGEAGFDPNTAYVLTSR